MKDRVSLFLCGNVMTGRGIDQVLRFRADRNSMRRLCTALEAMRHSLTRHYFVTGDSHEI